MSDKVYAELPTNINTLENEKFNLSDDGLIEIRAGEGTGTIYTELPRNINTLEKEKFVLDDDGRVAIRLSSSGGGIVKYANLAAFPVTGKPTLLYLAQDTGILYTWETTIYVAVSTTLALGETSTTAYRGDRGKTAYDHSQTPHDKAFVGLSNVDNTSDANKPISTATQTALDGKVDENVAIVASTNTKITYDSKGLVTAGTTLSESDIPALSIAKTTGLQDALDAKIVAPVSSVDNSVPKFDGITGKVLQDGTGVYIDDSGNLGINQATPTARLEVKGSGATSATSSLLVKNSSSAELFKVRDDVKIQINAATSVDGIVNIKANGAIGNSQALTIYDSNNVSRVRIKDNGITEWTLGAVGSLLYSTPSGMPGIVFFDTSSTSRSGLRLLSGGGLVFAASTSGADTNRMTIDSVGNVGMNEAVPTARLEVKGSGSTSATSSLIVKNSSNQVCLSVLDNRYVGIGETTPTRALVCNYNTSSTNAVASSFALKTTSSGDMADGFGGGMLWIIQDNNGIENLIAGMSAERDGADNTGQLRFRVFNAGSSVYPITIKNTGNVGINTETPTAKLDVNSDIIRLRTAKTPASATDTGNAGDICWDASYVYICVATNTWKRSAIATW